MSNNKSKFFTLLSQLNPIEWKHFVKYAFQNVQKEELLKLINILKKNYPKFDIQKQTTFELIYPNQSFNDHRYRNLIYQLHLQLISFLKSRELKSDEVSHLMYLKTLQKTNDIRRYNQELAALSKDNKSEGITYFLAYEKMNDATQSNRQADRNLQEVSDKLDMHYLNEKLKIICTAINDAKINNKDYTYGILSLIEENLNQLLQDKKSYSYLIYQCYLFLEHNDENSFNYVIEQLTKEKSIYKESEELRMIFAFCINFCIGQINKGQSSYFKNLFELYKLQLSYQVLYSREGYISSVTMKNLITVSLRLEEFKWTENFIEIHKEKLLPLHREEHYYYFLARLHYAKKNYDKAQYYLLLSEPEDFFNNLSVRVLQVKCYYENDNYEQLDNSLQNFKLYLLRHKNKTYHYMYHVQFIKYLNKIIKLPANRNMKDDLISKLKTEQQIAEKSWLLQLLT